MRAAIQTVIWFTLSQLVLAVGFGATASGGYWSTPQPLTPANSTLDDFGITFSHDQLTFYVQSNRGGAGSDIYMSSRADLNSPWGPLTPVTEWNTSEHDGASWISPDNREAYLFRHQYGATSANLYRSTRAQPSDPWGVPQLVPELNTSSADFGLRSFGNGTAGVLSSNRPGGDGNFDLWWTTRASPSDPWTTPTHIPNVNSSAYDAEAALSDDGFQLIFTSSRSGGVGQFDLYSATRNSLTDPFGSPALIPGINSTYDDVNAVLSPDGQTLYFRSTRPGGMGGADIWYAAWVPEPNSLLLLALGVGMARKRRHAGMA
ncbi:MAG TPA: PEP-CTERM sorting domain-containing protein [Phycisphaerae bacterium]|nr:PEP-CTERM sorting domain-containing protein [Phycisphaerae bacterium]